MENILIQVTQEQHESEERFIIGYMDAENELKTVIVNVSALTTEEQASYNAFKAIATTKTPQ